MNSTLEHKIAEFISLWCIEKGNLDNTQRPIISYGIELLLTSIWKFCLLLISGLLFKCFYEIAITIVDMSLRTY